MVETRGRFSAFNFAAAHSRSPSSGSDHSPEDTADLSDLVASFIERAGQTIPENSPDDEEMDCLDDDLEDVKERLRELLEDLSGGEERMGIMEATEIAGKFVGDTTQDGSPKGQLAAILRNERFDACLCKSRWGSSGKITAGQYEFVEVQCGGDRYIVERNLAGEFEIARPTKRYLSIINQVPRVFVGTPEELKQLVRIMCHEMRRSMKHVGIHVPPWRRSGYMEAKWFGFYKRTSNEMVDSSRDYTIKGCKELFWKAKDPEVMVGKLMAAFNAGRVQV